MIGFRRKVVCSLAIALALMYCSVMGQSETINFPPSSGVAGITKAPYNADPHGQADASAAIQAAFEANKGYMVIYFPIGTYKITKTVYSPLYNQMVYGTDTLKASARASPGFSAGRTKGTGSPRSCTAEQRKSSVFSSTPLPMQPTRPK